MRSLITAAVISIFYSNLLLANNSNTYIPSTPTFSIAPTNNESAVSLTPTFSGSEVSATDISSPDANYSIVSSEWIVYEATDPSISLFGGFEAFTNDLEFSATTFNEYDFPHSAIIDGDAVSRIRIYAAPKIELLSTSGEILAEVSMIPDFTDYVTHQPNRSAIVLAKAFDDAVVYNWHMQNSSKSPNNWASVFQIIVRYDGQVGVRSSINDLNNPFFSIQSSFQGIGCRLRNNGNLLFLMGNPSNWKATMLNSMESNFSFVCRPGVDEILLSTFSSAEPSPISMPNFVIKSSSESNVFSTLGSEELSPGKNYIGQVRYQVASDSKAGDNFSFWSLPVAFTTSNDDTNNSNDTENEYQLLLLDESAANLEAGEPAALIFDLTNLGDEIGTPTIFIRLPFNILTETSELPNALYEIRLASGSGNCKIEAKESFTIFACNILHLHPKSTIQIELTATFKGNDTSDRIGTAVCEEDSCTPVYNDFGLAVRQLTNSVPAEPNNNNESSSSSGGGAATLLLLLTVFLRRRDFLSTNQISI